MIDITLVDDAWKDVDAGTEALLDDWKVSEGDLVKQGQTVAVVVLVKTSFDVLAPVDGTIEQILVVKEDTFKRGQALALLKASA
jgi:biotin carboxyl carrier protein